jgi:hypothetical protein
VLMLVLTQFHPQFLWLLFFLQNDESPQSDLIQFKVYLKLLSSKKKRITESHQLASKFIAAHAINIFFRMGIFLALAIHELTFVGVGKFCEIKHSRSEA